MVGRARDVQRGAADPVIRLGVIVHVAAVDEEAAQRQVAQGGGIQQGCPPTPVQRVRRRVAGQEELDHLNVLVSHRVVEGGAAALLG